MLRDLFSLFPAHAGVIPSKAFNYTAGYAFPRTCGGDPEAEQSKWPDAKLFPAHAGVILDALPSALASCAFPRTRGGDPTTVRPMPMYSVFSPHMRG